MTLDEVMARLRDALQARQEVRLAFLFGSSLSRGVDSAGDLDLAVVFTRPLPLLEQCELATQLEEAMGHEIDLIDLDGASTLLRWEVVRTGIPVLVRDAAALVDFRARVPLEYFDLLPFLEREAAGLREVLEQSRWSSSKP